MTSQLTNVLVIGGGGREHAIAWKLRQSPKVGDVHVAPGNAGTDHPDNKMFNVNIGVKEFDKLIAFAKDKSVGLTVVGPEEPLCLGVVDAFQKEGLRIFGPSQEAAKLEASKAYSKEFMDKYNVPTAKYKSFVSADYGAAQQYIKDAEFDVVLKASGLAAGKGVLIPTSKEDALNGLKRILVDKEFGNAGDEVVIEELLVGEEASILAFCDGNVALSCLASQDHKRALDGDQGPNTGGMGAYAPAPVITKEIQGMIEKEVLAPTMEGMKKDGAPFHGILFVGIMVVNGKPLVLEYNCRFGDPETEAVLPLMETDLYEAFQACIDGALDKLPLTFKTGSAATVVAASPGYPGSYPKGNEITGIADAEASVEGLTVFHAGTKKDGEGKTVTNGGRVLAVSAVGSDLQTAVNRAYDGLSKIKFDGGMHFRKDIAKRAL